MSPGLKDAVKTFCATDALGIAGGFCVGLPSVFQTQSHWGLAKSLRVFHRVVFRHPPVPAKQGAVLVQLTSVFGLLLIGGGRPSQGQTISRDGGRWLQWSVRPY